MRSDKYLDSTITIWCLTMSNWWLCATSGECAMSGSSSTAKPTSFRARNGNLWHHIIWVTLRRGLGSAVTVFKSSRSQVRKLLRDLFVTTDWDHWANIGLWRVDYSTVWSPWKESVFDLLKSLLVALPLVGKVHSSVFLVRKSSWKDKQIACWKGWKKKSV